MTSRSVREAAVPIDYDSEGEPIYSTGPADLECPVCGDTAIHSETGLFYEDEGERCASCDVEGHVNVDTDGVAYWWTNEDAT